MYSHADPYDDGTLITDASFPLRFQDGDIVTRRYAFGYSGQYPDNQVFVRNDIQTKVVAAVKRTQSFGGVRPNADATIAALREKYGEFREWGDGFQDNRYLIWGGGPDMQTDEGTEACVRFTDAMFEWLNFQENPAYDELKCGKFSSVKLETGRDNDQTTVIYSLTMQVVDTEALKRNYQMIVHEVRYAEAKWAEKHKKAAAPI